MDLFKNNPISDSSIQVVLTPQQIQYFFDNLRFTHFVSINNKNFAVKVFNVISVL